MPWVWPSKEKIKKIKASGGEGECWKDGQEMGAKGYVEWRKDLTQLPGAGLGQGGVEGWPAPTFALEAMGGGGEQESVSHGLGATAAGDARLLVARLHPLRQPAQTAVAVQWVGSQCPRRQSRKSALPNLDPVWSGSGASGKAEFPNFG